MERRVAGLFRGKAVSAKARGAAVRRFQDFEQWVAGSICMALAAAALFLLVRTRGRKMALEDGRVTAAGRQFRVEDIARLDLRRWKMKGWPMRC